MNVLERIFLNSHNFGNTERREDGVFFWDVEELTLIMKIVVKLCVQEEVVADS